MKPAYLQQVETGKTQYLYSRGRRTTKTIREMLKARGYSEELIKELHNDRRILTRPKALSRKLAASEELYIIPASSDLPTDPPADNSLDRFKDL